ncbi:hypothetical protein SapgrDRAFT_2371 [Saprospira grandis DSM 2844]|uniref:Outer membrane protein beta-barrel domain-containing protein n=1 Tax=Saprospira grandis DSM 2844 TaxID=694433 RepID=J0P8Z5_9BACT|nr:hypothetical protein [Saprospira grandis]EJF54037.1 hypothetical protein SapgrDRAFT_2371 [Saprospira grandis DSM 2844]
MKQFYEQDDDFIRSQLEGHQFEMPPAAWEDMDKRLDQIQLTGAKGNSAWSNWLVMGAFVLASGAGVLAYQYCLPFLGMPQKMAQKEALLEKAAEPQLIQLEERALAATTSEEVLPLATANSTPPPPPEKPTKEKVVASLAPKAQKVILLEEEQNATEKGQNMHPEVKQTILPTRYVYSASSRAKAEQLREIQRLENLSFLEKGSFQQQLHHSQKTTLDTPMIVLDRYHKGGKKLQLSANLGLNAQAKALGVQLGLQLQQELDDQFSLEMGLQYKNMQQLGNRSEMAMLEWNGELQEEQIQAIKRLEFLELPILLNYKLLPKHQLQMGAKVSYLLPVQMTNGQRTADDLGFNSWSSAVVLGYHYQLNEQLKLGVQCNLAFANLAKNSRQKAHQANQEVSAQLLEEDKLPQDECLLPEQNGNELKLSRLPYKLYNNDLSIQLQYQF